MLSATKKYVCGTYELREMRLSQGGLPVSHLRLHKVPIRSERGCISKAATEERKSCERRGVKISTTDYGKIKIINASPSEYKSDGRETAELIFGRKRK